MAEANASSSSSSKEKSNVIYISHLPKNFVESGMRPYFSQFGDVVRVKHCRSKKTGNSKGYGFVWFSSSDVAAVAANAMNNYLVYNKLMKCRVLNKSDVPKTLLKCKGRFTASRWPHIQISRQNRPKSAAKDNVLKERMLKNLDKKNAKLAQLGINYLFKPPVGDAVNPAIYVKTKKEESLDESCSAVDASCASVFVDSSDEEVTIAVPKNVIKRTKKEKAFLKNKPAVSIKKTERKTVKRKSV